MAYDEETAERIREIVLGRKGVDEMKMFGGVAFTVHGHMFVGVVKDDLCVRFPAEDTESMMKKPHVRPMDFTKKPMSGWAFVAPDGFETDKQLIAWVDRGWELASALPPKKAKKKRA